MVYALISGCACRHLAPTFGTSPASAHRRFTVWTEAGLWHRLHRAVLDELGARGQVDWTSANVDAASVRAKREGSLTGPNPVDRGKKVSKLHMLSDAQGIPLAVAVPGANVHDSLALKPLIRGIPDRPVLPGTTGRGRRCSSSGRREEERVSRTSRAVRSRNEEAGVRAVTKRRGHLRRGRVSMTGRALARRSAGPDALSAVGLGEAGGCGRVRDRAGGLGPELAVPAGVQPGGDLRQGAAAGRGVDVEV
ncbi:MAG: transposase [Streptomyces sp.]|nr:transposase [Streptomyces sp.]